MTIGSSIVMIAIGAILAYAVKADISGIDIQTVGIILIVLGIIGLILSLLYTFMWSGGRRRDVVDEVPVRERERTYRERL
jgi:hypothetical protein